MCTWEDFIKNPNNKLFNTSEDKITASRMIENHTALFFPSNFCNFLNLIIQQVVVGLPSC